MCKTKEMLDLNYVCTVTESVCDAPFYVFVYARVGLHTHTLDALPEEKKLSPRAALKSALPWLLLTRSVWVCEQGVFDLLSGISLLVF